jgi:Spy/CpxP family protein refolding chaperone
MIRESLTTLVLAGTVLTAQAPGFPPPPGGPDGGMRREGPGGHQRPGPEGLLADLNLTPDQDKAIHALMEKHRASDKAKRRAAEDADDAFRQALEDPAVSDAQLKPLHDAASEAHFQMFLEHRALRREIDAVLTPDQRTKARRRPLR